MMAVPHMDDQYIYHELDQQLTDQLPQSHYVFHPVHVIYWKVASVLVEAYSSSISYSDDLTDW